MSQALHRVGKSLSHDLSQSCVSGGAMTARAAHTATFARRGWGAGMQNSETNRVKPLIGHAKGCFTKCFTGCFTQRFTPLSPARPWRTGGAHE